MHILAKNLGSIKRIVLFVLLIVSDSVRCSEKSSNLPYVIQPAVVYD